MIEVKMPALSPTMEKGTLAKWLVARGDSVKRGDLLAEIETDKATMELEAVDDGRIGELLVAEGTDDIPVGMTIGTLVCADDPIEPANRGIASSTSKAPRTANRAPLATGGGDVAQPQPAPDARPDEDAGQIMRPAVDARATPLAARFAAARSIDLSSRHGSDRIRITDLVWRPARNPIAATTSGARAPDDVSRLDDPDMRKTIAQRLPQADQRAPHLYLTVDFRIDPLLTLRADLNAALAARGITLSVNDFMIKGLAMALVSEPACTVDHAPGAPIRGERADVAIAVSIPDCRVTAVIKGADRLSLSAIALTMQDLADRARSGGVNPQEHAGRSVGLTNLGMFGIDQFAAVPNPAQAAILAIGAGRTRPWDVGGTIGLATIATVTGSFDSRAIDSADAARILSAFRRLIENPLDLTG